jgi:hypothetical protein
VLFANAVATTSRDIAVTILVMAVLLNYPWEMAQAGLFAPMGSAAEASWRCFVASVGDGLMILMIFAVGWVIHDDTRWFRRWSAGRLGYTMFAGGLGGAAIETWGLAAGRWQYADSMPRVPVLELGLVPLLQMSILALLTFWATARWLKHRESRAEIRKHSR